MWFSDPLILKWAPLNWKPVLSWQQEPIMARLVTYSPTFRLLFGRYNSKHQSNVTESKVCASRIIQASVMGTWRKFSPQGDWPRWKCKHLYIFPANVDLHLNKDPLVKDNLFLLRDLLSFWVGSSLSLFWEGNNQKHRRHWSYMRDLIYMFIKHKKLYNPTQNMKCLCLCIVFAKYAISDEAVWFSDLFSSHSLQSSPTSLFAGAFQRFASPTEWFVFCDKIFEESNTGLKQFTFPTDWSWSHKHHYAPFNTHSCHLVSRTQRPGW